MAFRSQYRPELLDIGDIRTPFNAHSLCDRIKALKNKYIIV